MSVQKEKFDPKKEEEERKKKIYIPGDYTDDKYKHYTYDKLVQETLNSNKEFRTTEKGYPRYREDFGKKLEEEEKDLKKEADNFAELNKEMMCQHIHLKKAKKHKDPSEPFRAAVKNFELAKKLHKENLEHEPLPDTITDALYRKMQMQAGCSEPGLMLKDGNFATGVGWKGYPGYGATRCTKLKVYRPKTGVAIKGGYKVERPASVSSFDKKWRFIRQEKVSPIELAICWDLTPLNPFDEPKPPTHIDGSNGSQAPAVFSLVHTPKEEDDVVQKSSPTHIPLAKLEIKCKNAKDCCGSSFTTSTSSGCSKCKKQRPKTAWVKKQSSEEENSSKSSSQTTQIKRAQSAYNLQDIAKRKHSPKCSSKESSTTTQSSNLSKKKLCQSTPNLSEYQECFKFCSKECFNKRNKHHNRICVACELKNVNLKEKRPKNEYKMAFKAGVPHKIVSTDFSKNVKLNVKLLRIPKPKHPYQIRNYAINSLAPPFSLQKDKRQDYPEHWRLASVYQHSYKPMHTRKRPLLATVYQ